MRFRTPLLITVLLLGLLSLTGCTPRIDVPSVPAEALKQGEGKEDLARKAADAKSSETAKLWQDAAAYYTAVAGKFPDQREGHAGRA